MTTLHAGIAPVPREPGSPRRLRVAVIGGGSGLPRVLAGLARFAEGGQALPPVEVTCVIAAGGLRPEPELAAGSIEALRLADVVILGPARLQHGLACLELPGVAPALREGRALRVLVACLDEASVAEHLRAMTGAGAALDVVLVDEQQAGERRAIAALGSLPLEAHLREESGDILRHHPERTAAAVLGLAVDAVVA